MIRSYCLTLLYVLSFWTNGHAQFTREHLSQLDTLTCDEPSVTLHVFSGTPDPTWNINQQELNKFKSLTREILLRSDNNTVFHRSTTRVMGYHGFTLSCSTDASVFLHGLYPAERELLASGRKHLSRSVIQHVKEHLGEVMADLTERHDNNVDCNKVPITGPDSVPSYDPNNDDGGCFVKKQSENNCYAYGTDIVTNTFPQPGRGSGKKWTLNTCQDMGNASIRDGLVYNGTVLPKAPPEKGHFAALLIWPETNFHWIRMDANGYWSHKPGGTPVRNRDNQNLPITDPSKSDFSPWTQFCFYFVAQPSVLKIN